MLKEQQELVSEEELSVSAAQWPAKAAAQQYKQRWWCGANHREHAGEDTSWFYLKVHSVIL